MRSTFIVAAIFLCTPAIAAQNRDIQSGNYFLPACKASIARTANHLSDAYEQGICVGVIETLLDVGEILSPPHRFCSPAGVTTGQALRVSVAFLEANPHRLHESFVVLTVEAFGRAWPCNGN